MAKKITTEEVEIAFAKLQANVYFDNYDLILRGRIATYKKRLNANVKSFIEECEATNPFKRILDKIDLSILPKKVEPKAKKFPSNYYTNTAPIIGNEISRPNVHCNFPVELHLVATIWLMRYGTYVEKMIPKSSHGNRLIIDKNTGNIEGRSLFKPYFKQFQNWWSLAIKATKTALKQKQSVTILNFDLKSFYHEVKFDFGRLEDTLIKKIPSIENDIIHSILKEIHFSYRHLLSKRNNSISTVDNIYPLPIGLFTSHVFANFHLRGLDRFIRDECDTIYYGRYVDDVLIVVKNTILEEDAIKEGVSKSDDREIIKLYLKNYFSKLFIVPETDKPIRFKIASVKDLKLNMEKLFIYQFDQAHSPNLIDKFVEEQKERSSMFRFLSDEEDESFDDFESQTFESNFDHVDLNKARFKNLEDNKYKLSTFFSKLIRRRIQRGAGYRESEIEKIQKYFKGGYLIKHYFFWEKLLTLLVVYKRKDELSDLVNEIFYEIESIQISASEENKNFNVSIDDYKTSLKMHLQNALAMSLGLNLDMLKENPILIDSLSQQLNIREKSSSSDSSVRSQLETKYSVFRDTGLLRGAFIFYPLFQFTRFAFEHKIDLTSSESIFQIADDEDIESAFVIRRSGFVPFRVKFWQVALLIYSRNLLKTKKQSAPKWHTDKFSSNELLNAAFSLFYKINKPSVPEHILKEEYFLSAKTDNGDEKDDWITLDRANNFRIHEIYMPNGGDIQETYRVALINKYVDSSDYLASLDGNPVKDPDKIEVFDRILDEVAQIKKCDLFVMPELSLPYRLVTKYTNQVARTQIGYVGGIEHLRIQNVGFNFILTILPINIGGDKDAIPVFRLKNHYAPIEEECIWDRKARGDKMTVPKPSPYRYDLFEWRGLYFSSYYCYELADVFHRSIFFSKVDAIIAPVWNADTHYYNSIVDAATRDMHNYFIIVNTSQYGFTKIARPHDHVNKEKVIVKGGTEKEYNFTIVVGDLKVAELRAFQKLNHQEQKVAKEADKSIKFKPTPPDFPKENVIKREKNRSFYM